MQYYVDNSFYFDTHPYSVPVISKAVKAAGGRNVRSTLKRGWSNRPSVVTFEAMPTALKKIESAVQGAVGTQWIIIRQKDW